MKRLSILTVALMFALTASSDNYPYLSFQTSSGSVVSLPSEGLNLSFSDKALVAQSGDNTTEFALADLTRMFFSQSATTAISDLTADRTTSSLAVYTVSGVYVGTFDSERSLRRNVDSGIYIVKTNGKTLKMTVR